MGSDDPGLLISEAAALLGVSVKAIRVYHARGLLPEAERDESGYRRYGAPALLALGRIVRLRAIGLPLREIAALASDDRGSALRARLTELDGELAGEITERELRRTLLAQLLAEGIDDPIAASTAELWEDHSVALLRATVPDLTPEQELVERRVSRALAAFMPAAGPAEKEGLDAVFAVLERGLPNFVDQHQRFHALADADADDPRVDQLAEEMRGSLRGMMDDMPAVLLEQPSTDEEEWRRMNAGLGAALETLAPAQRRVMNLALAPLVARHRP